MIQGLQRLMETNEVPLGGDASMRAAESFSVGNDPLTHFVRERCQVGHGLRESRTNLLGAYRDFLDHHNLPAVLDGWFLKGLMERYPSFKTVRTRPSDGGPRERCVEGIRIRPELFFPDGGSE